MRISDWSSDVCSSDLRGVRAGAANPRALCRRKLGSLVDGRGRVMKLSSLSAQRSRAPWLPLLCHFRPTIECASVIEFRVAPVAEPEVEPGQILSHRAKPIRRDMKQRSEEHTSELQSLMRISYAAFCLKTKKLTT